MIINVISISGWNCQAQLTQLTQLTLPPRASPERPGGRHPGQQPQSSLGNSAFVQETAIGGIKWDKIM